MSRISSPPVPPGPVSAQLAAHFGTPNMALVAARPQTGSPRPARPSEALLPPIHRPTGRPAHPGQPVPAPTGYPRPTTPLNHTPLLHRGNIGVGCAAMLHRCSCGPGAGAGWVRASSPGRSRSVGRRSGRAATLHGERRAERLVHRRVVGVAAGRRDRGPQRGGSHDSALITGTTFRPSWCRQSGRRIVEALRCCAEVTSGHLPRARGNRQFVRTCGESVIGQTSQSSLDTEPGR
jgi:hypothetical protein